MPEYLAPGVYVEETSFRAKSIEGVGTSTTAFVGPTRRGPLASTRRNAQSNTPPAPPELLTSFGDFVRVYGALLGILGARQREQSCRERSRPLRRCLDVEHRVALLVVGQVGVEQVVGC